MIAGRYRLDGVVAHGRMGVVYRATHLPTGASVALKRIQPQSRARRDLQERFEREALGLRRLFHDHIVRYYDHGEDEAGQPFIVTELLEGHPATALLRAALPLRDKIAALTQVCDAVAYANGCGIIHRDLKWSNVMVTLDRCARVTLKLIDFGLLKSVTAGFARTGQRLTVPGAIVGSPCYVSPEQILDRAIDARSDVYSLGVMAYELLSGERPFTSHDPREIVWKHLQEIPRDLMEYDGIDVPATVAAAVTQALAKDPAKRFASAGQLQRALAGAVRADDRLRGQLALGRWV